MTMPSILDAGLKLKGMVIQPFLQELVPLKVGNYRFKMECLVDIRGGKNIVKTEVPGLDGTIKEMTGFSDYTISVQATLQGYDNDDVREELKKVLMEWNKKESLPIVCPKTDDYGIDRIVFESISHPELQGLEATERLTLTFLSDTEYEFEVE